MRDQEQELRKARDELEIKLAEQMAGSGWQALIHPDDLERHAAKWMEAVAIGKPHENEVRSRRSDGQYRWQLDRGVPLRDEDGNSSSGMGSRPTSKIADGAEDKIREQEAELRQILDLTPQHLFVFGPDGIPLHANRASLEYFGVNIDQLLGESRINFVHPDDRAGFLGEREKGLPHEFEARLLRYDRSFRWFLVRRNPFKNEEGHITRWYRAATDIEDRKRTVEALQQSQFYLAEGQRLAHMGSWAFNTAGFFDYWSEELLFLGSLRRHSGN